MKTFIPLMRTISAALLLCCVFFGAVAQEKKAVEVPKTVQGSFLKQSMRIENQFVKLAEATPQEKYMWRPAEGVRSVAESFLHVAVGNYITLTVMGGKVPEGINPRELEKSTTDKAKIVEAVKQSFNALNDFVKTIPDNDLERQVDFFGNPMSILDMVMLAANHQHETLGQAIAYARTNGVKPPWSNM